jgi:flavin reductase (DIM6/NTAB) family NADH-FMN oxidoreductase RutF
MTSVGEAASADWEAGEQYDFHCYEPAQGHGLKHNPMQAIVAPRPIGWISSISQTGHNNLAPYSFFTMLRHDPPLIGFSSGGRKDSMRNIEETGRFVWNLATRPLASSMNISSSIVPREVDEFVLAGLTPVPSSFGTPAYVGESPVSFDCVLTQIVDLRDRHGQPSGSHLIIGEAVHVRISRHLILDGVYDTLKGEPIMRGGGISEYFHLTADGHFHMLRPEQQ